MNNFQTHSVVPALPGWYSVCPIIEQDNRVIGLMETPILAWAIPVDWSKEGDPEYRYAAPITFEAPDDNAILLAPNGIYYDPHEQIFESKQDVIDFFNQQRLKKLPQSVNGPIQ